MEHNRIILFEEQRVERHIGCITIDYDAIFMPMENAAAEHDRRHPFPAA